MLQGVNIQHHDDALRQVWQPSQLSVIVTILLIVGISFGTVYFIFVYGSQIGAFLQIGLESQATTNASNLQQVRYAVDNSSLAANFSVFAFWFMVGGLCYLGVTSAWQLFVALRWNLASVVTEGYSGKFETLVEIVARLGLRALGLGLLAICYFVVIYLTPWFILWLYKLSSVSFSMKDALIVAAVISLVVLIIHSATVGLRLLVLRVRLFS